MAATVWAAERPLPRAYRRAGFHAISESTRDDLVARGVAAERIRVIHPGVDAARFTPAPDGGRAADPTFLYVGRLKRYKGIELAIRALALARAAGGPISRSTSRAPATTAAELERLAAELGLRIGRAVSRVSSARPRSSSCCGGPGPTCFRRPRKGGASRSSRPPPAARRRSPRTVRACATRCAHGETGYLVPHGDVDGAGRTDAGAGRRRPTAWPRSAPAPAASPRASPGSGPRPTRSDISTTSSPARARA